MTDAKRISDAVEVVRCKDCKYGGDRPSSFWKEHIVCTRRKVVDYVKPDDFCSYGERGKGNA